MSKTSISELVYI